jgi:hypothetical protein
VVGADGQEVLAASSSSLLSMVQRIATLRRSLGPGLPPEQPHLGGAAGTTGGGAAGPNEERAVQSAVGGETAAASGEQQAETGRLLARALANVQRLTTLIRERDAR